MKECVEKLNMSDDELTEEEKRIMEEDVLEFFEIESSYFPNNT